MLDFSILKVTEDGLFYTFSVALRLLNLVLVASILFNLHYYEYINAFHKWKIPYEISFMVAATINFLKIFSQIFTQKRESLYLRGIDLKKLPIKKKIKAYISLVFPVVAAALNSISYRAISLDLKAFRLYKTRTFYFEKKLNTYDILIQTFTISVFIIFIMIKIFQRI